MGKVERFDPHSTFCACSRFPTRLCTRQQAGNLSIVCFSAEGIQLAAKLLADKFQCAPDRLLFVGGFSD